MGWVGGLDEGVRGTADLTVGVEQGPRWKLGFLEGGDWEVRDGSVGDLEEILVESK